MLNYGTEFFKKTYTHKQTQTFFRDRRIFSIGCLHAYSSPFLNLPAGQITPTSRPCTRFTWKSETFLHPPAFSPIFAPNIPLGLSSVYPNSRPPLSLTRGKRGQAGLAWPSKADQIFSLLPTRLACRPPAQLEDLPAWADNVEPGRGRPKFGHLCAGLVAQLVPRSSRKLGAPVGRVRTSIHE